MKTNIILEGSGSIENWMLKNGYIFHDGIYTNYRIGITIKLNEQQKPLIHSLFGFETEDYVALYTAMLKYGLVELY